MNYTFRPLSAWTEGNTSPRRGSHLFRASWRDTLKLLGRELEYLDARNVVLQVDVREGDVRLDGMLRADAKVGAHPGVRIAFDSRFGPLTYATDAYEQHYSGAAPGWQANVRAIALGLAALRAVDRYGVTRRGEQYTGWKQITAGPTAMPAAMTVEDAARFLAEQACITRDDPTALNAADVLPDPSYAYRLAAKRLHPDVGGDPALFRRLQDAKELLDRHGGP